MMMEAQLGLDFSSPECRLPNGPAPDTSSSKMYLVSSQATKAETLLPWLEKWLGANSTYRETVGETPVLLSARKGWSNGQLWTRNSCEWNPILAPCLRDEGVSSLSEILETGQIDPRYFLSAKACSGILRRADKRGKELPPALRQALQQVVAASSELARVVDKIQSSLSPQP
jgi:hypothetical protein